MVALEEELMFVGIDLSLRRILEEQRYGGVDYEPDVPAVVRTGSGDHPGLCLNANEILRHFSPTIQVAQRGHGNMHYL